MPDFGRTPDAGSCPYGAHDSAKYAVSAVIAFLKGKSAITVARLQGKERNFSGKHLWARGYAASTVGFKLETVQRYVREQDDADEAGRF